MLLVGPAANHQIRAKPAAAVPNSSCHGEEKISEQSGISQGLVLQAVQTVFDGIRETLVEEGRIELRNFGIFEVKRRRTRKARNSRTGGSVSVPERSVVTFKPGLEMEERVNQLDGLPGKE